MKKPLLFASLFLSFAVGCEREHAELPAPGAGSGARTVSEVVPVGEALDRLQSFRDALNPATRGLSGDLLAVESVAVSGGQALSRNGEAQISDTMVYVVNFADDKGFAVLGARRSLEDIYVLAESGSLDAARLDAVMARLASGTISSSRAADDSALASPEDFIYDMLGASLLDLGSGSIIGGDYDPIDPMVLISSRSWWEITEQKGVYGSAKWNQTHPFNWSMPETDIPDYAGSAYMWRHPVGCGVVAMAQVMSAVRHPAKAPAAVNLFYDWGDLLTVSNYETLPDYLPMKYSGVNSENTKHLADVLYYLGRRFGAAYGVEGGTGVKFEQIIPVLKGMDAYYANAKYDEYDQQSIVSMLCAGKPVVVTGVDNSAGGHAWVFDGYAKAFKNTENVYREKSSGELKTFLLKGLSKEMFHINWGYSGACDGYFSAGLFYGMQYRDFQDDEVDANIDVKHEESFQYQFGKLKAIYY